MSQDADKHDPEVRHWRDQIDCAQQHLDECDDPVERTYIRADIRRMKQQLSHRRGKLAAARSGELNVDQYPY
jgi:hypothetical protein